MAAMPTEFYRRQRDDLASKQRDQQIYNKLLDVEMKLDLLLKASGIEASRESSTESSSPESSA